MNVQSDKTSSYGQEFGKCLDCGGSMRMYRTGDRTALMCAVEAKHSGMVPLENYPINQHTAGNKWSKFAATMIMATFIACVCAFFIRLALLFFGV